jgi:ankyrin repeat protein
MTSLSNLPDELIILIAEACDVPDKARLARSNRRLNDLATRVLLRYSVREEGNSAMYWAAKHGHINTLERMRSCGAEVNDNSGSRLSIVVKRLDSLPWENLHTTAGFLPLHVAAKFGQDTAVKWLLSKGARLESLAQNLCQCESQITEAHAYGNNRWNLWTPLHIAICSGHISTARLLISRGASIRSPGSGPFLSTNVFHTAARRNNTAAINFLVGSGLVGVDEPDSMGYVALHYACVCSDNLPAIKTLIHLGASLDMLARGHKTPLHLACETGFFDGAIELLKKGAVHDISNLGGAANLLHKATQPYSSFPLPLPSPDPAIWEECREDFIRRLVALGVNVDLRILSLTPLTIVAADHRSLVRTLQVFIDLGADVNAMDAMKRNPIYALLNGNGERDFYTTTANKVDFLLRYGARPDLQTKYGFSAFDMALGISLSTGDASIMGFIFQHGMVANYGHKYLHDKIIRSYEYLRIDECRLLASQGAVLKLSDKQLRDDIRLSVRQRNLKQMKLLLDLFPGRIEPFEIFNLAIYYYKKAEERDINFIKSLLARPEFDSDGSSDASRLLQFACRHHSPVFIAQLLIEKGGQLNEFDSYWETPLS